MVDKIFITPPRRPRGFETGTSAWTNAANATGSHDYLFARLA